jgi:NADH-quinone oxidoreductase subunit E
VGLNATKVGLDLVRLGRELSFTPEDQAKVKEILARYPADRRASAIMPVLWLAQERFEFLSKEAIDLTARSIDVPLAEVAAVASFYTMYHLEPVGKYVIQVCCTLSCSIMGAERVFAHMERKLGIKAGETTPDGRFTLKKVECLASCGSAPMLQVNERTFDENLDEAAVDRLLDGLK